MSASLCFLISLMTVAKASGLAPFSHRLTHRAKDSESRPVLSSLDRSSRVEKVSLAANSWEEDEEEEEEALAEVVLVALLEAGREDEDWDWEEDGRVGWLLAAIRSERWGGDNKKFLRIFFFQIFLPIF